MVIRRLKSIHDRVFVAIERLAGEWLLGLTARLVFSSVLLVFFLHSAATKVGTGFPGSLIPGAGAYAQIIPHVAEATSYDVSQIAFLPWGLIVTLGTYAEVILPCLILVGLFTRAASAAMIGFIAVMTMTDVWGHGLDAKSVGALFDRVQDSVVSDQRLLWIFPLVYLVVKGAGALSVDGLLARFYQTRN
ncbi:MAG: DoxX family protein [Rhodospirillales bacterium]